jgi:serine/threonine-protein kinase RsbW
LPERRGAARAAEIVEVTIPPKPEFVSVARLTAATVAARQSFTYDEIEDLKIAVSEACTALMVSGTEGAPLTVRLTLGTQALEIDIETRGPGVELVEVPSQTAKEPLDETQLGLFLMRCLVDEVEVGRSPEGRAQIRLVKRRQP